MQKINRFEQDGDITFSSIVSDLDELSGSFALRVVVLKSMFSQVKTINHPSYRLTTKEQVETFIEMLRLASLELN